MTSRTTKNNPNDRHNYPPHASSFTANSDIEEHLFSKGFNGHLVRRIMSYTKKYRKLLTIAFVMALLFTAAEVSIPLIIRAVIDQALFQSQRQFVLSTAQQAIIIGALVFLGFVLMRFIATLFQENIVGRVGEMMIIDMRRSMFEHLQKVSLSFMDKTEVGRLMSRLQGDTAALAEFIETSVAAMRELVMLLAIGVTIVWLDWRLGLITLTFIPLLLLVRILWLPYARRAFVFSRVTSSRVSGALAENINGVRVVEGMNRQNVNLMLFNGIATENLNAQLRAARWSQIMIPTVDLFTGLAFAGVIVTIAWLSTSTSAVFEIPTMVAFFLYVQRFFDPIRSLTLQYNIFQRAMASGERIFEVLDVAEEVKDSPNAKSPDSIDGSIEFKNVLFGYNKGQPILKDISFTVNPGETVALVGPTGSGKTSITSLVHRFYDVWEGSVKVGGYDVRDLSHKSLGKHIGMVLQEPFIFSGTIFENIRYSTNQATHEQVIQAAKDVGAHDFIMQLPQAYETVLGQRGGDLSIGQRQLISFARAIVSATKILVLDEATASIDSYTEMLIQRALKRLLKGRTGLIIAHRLATVRAANKIIVLQNGQIIESGSQQELIQSNGLFAKLYSMNYTSFDDAQADEL